MLRRTLLSLTASAAILGTAFFGAACGGDDDDGNSSNSDGKPVIVATTVQIGALAREVGGDKIALTVLIGPGTDPHDYELTAQDRKRVDESRLILRNGIGLDGFLDPVLESDGNDDKVVTVTTASTFVRPPRRTKAATTPVTTMTTATRTSGRTRRTTR